MKKHIREFLRRGLPACGLGPIILAVVYLILHRFCGVQTLTVYEVCLGIVSLSVLAFVAGGLNILYQFERLPLMTAILIHGGILYISYLLTYLLNGWLDRDARPILIFSGIFIFGYFLIWAMIYTITKRNTAKLNKILQQKQQSSPEV